MIVSCTFVDVKVQPTQSLLKVGIGVNNQWVGTIRDAIPLHFVRWNLVPRYKNINTEDSSVQVDFVNSVTLSVAHI